MKIENHLAEISNGSIINSFHENVYLYLGEKFKKTELIKDINSKEIRDKIKNKYKDDFIKTKDFEWCDKNYKL